MEKYAKFRSFSEAEMQQITGGFADPVGTSCEDTGTPCSYYEAGTGIVPGKCQVNSNARCVCKAANSSIVANVCGDFGRGSL